MSDYLWDRSQVVGSNNAFMGIGRLSTKCTWFTHVLAKHGKIPDGELCSDNFLNKKRNKSSKYFDKKRNVIRVGPRARGGRVRVSCQTGVTLTMSKSPPPLQFKCLVIYDKN